MEGDKEHEPGNSSAHPTGPGDQSDRMLPEPETGYSQAHNTVFFLAHNLAWKPEVTACIYLVKTSVVAEYFKMRCRVKPDAIHCSTAFLLKIGDLLGELSTQAHRAVCPVALWCAHCKLQIDNTRSPIYQNNGLSREKSCARSTAG
jgi:hypothetical protein